MYRFGISYFTMQDGIRIPLVGIEVRLVKLDYKWGDGIKAYEKGEKSGYYETDIIPEDKSGFYEIWDTKTSPEGSFSGKVCMVGKLTADSIAKDTITGDRIAKETITGDKLKKHTITCKQIKEDQISIPKFACEIQCELQGHGNRSGRNPAVFGDDEYALHQLEKQYNKLPYVIITPNCDCGIYVREVRFKDEIVYVDIGLGDRHPNPDLRYTILVIRNEDD